MPIQVTCRKCHKRFNVSEEHAGKTGACPNCKGQITVPKKDEEVVIHAPSSFGPKDASGQAVLKPIEREEVVANPAAIVGIVGAVIAAIVVAVVLRVQYPSGETGIDPTLWWILAAGTIVLAPGIALAGYWFLRNDELEPHRGVALLLRVTICSVLYAALWGGYAALKHYMFRGNPPEMFYFAAIAPAFIGVGGTIGLATLDLDFGNAAIHYAFYLLVTALFCFLIGVPVI